MVNEIKKHWLMIAAICAVGYYVWKQQQNTATKNAPAGGATP